MCDFAQFFKRIRNLRDVKELRKQDRNAITQKVTVCQRHAIDLPLHKIKLKGF